MASSEAKATTAIRALGSPGDVLRLLRGNFLADRRIAFMGTILAAGGGGWRHGGKNGGHILHTFTEVHVEVPLIVGGKGLHPARHRMLGQGDEIRIPMGVHAPVHLKGATDPFDPLVATLFLGGFGGVMHAHQSATTLHFLAQIGQVSALQSRMPATAIGVNQNGVRLVQFLDGWPVGIQVMLHLHLARCALFEAFLEQQHTGVVLVFAVAVAGLAGDQDDELLGTVGKGRRSGERERGKE